MNGKRIIDTHNISIKVFINQQDKRERNTVKILSDLTGKSREHTEKRNKSFQVSDRILTVFLSVSYFVVH